MSNEPKPEPRVDEDGVPWCTASCTLSQDYQCNYRHVNGRTIACEPAVREMAAELERLRNVLSQLADAAAVFRADQQLATDPRCGLVQPVDVEDCENLNRAVANAYSIIEATGGE